MSIATTMQPHIAYELIDANCPDVVVIEFLSQEVVGPIAARELGAQLDGLIRHNLPRVFVMDFANIRSLGSTALGEIMVFARKIARLYICNMRENVRIGAGLVGLDECAEVASSRWAAINAARRLAIHGEEDTVDYPLAWIEANVAAFHVSDVR